ncbi:hypothetical protein CBR_g37623 [Chara braunii]|uniref:Reverse transcriptase n=1 Tax=Chara braunii TaxID=69332 RepID=A0A388LNN0_CHABU|nr:hypothetical protein CBR_g37623 [Chara braunii]|eukprot:GBG83823.1 hypothetical protein CBR_g37623 [Chara braunii]
MPAVLVSPDGKKVVRIARACGDDVSSTIGRSVGGLGGKDRTISRRHVALYWEENQQELKAGHGAGDRSTNSVREVQSALTCKEDDGRLSPKGCSQGIAKGQGGASNTGEKDERVEGDEDARNEGSGQEEGGGEGGRQVREGERGDWRVTFEEAAKKRRREVEGGWESREEEERCVKRVRKAGQDGEREVVVVVEGEEREEGERKRRWRIRGVVLGSNPICVVRRGRAYARPVAGSDFFGGNELGVSSLPPSIGAQSGASLARFIGGGEEFILEEGDQISLSLSHPYFLSVAEEEEQHVRVGRAEGEEEEEEKEVEKGGGASPSFLSGSLPASGLLKGTAEKTVGTRGRLAESAEICDSVIGIGTADRDQAEGSHQGARDQYARDGRQRDRGRPEVGDRRRDRDGDGFGSDRSVGHAAELARVPSTPLVEREGPIEASHPTAARPKYKDGDVMRKNGATGSGMLESPQGDRAALVKEFGIIVEGHEFDEYEKRIASLSRPWDWRIGKKKRSESDEEDSDEEEEHHGRTDTGGGRHGSTTSERIEQPHRSAFLHQPGEPTEPAGSRLRPVGSDAAPGAFGGSPSRTDDHGSPSTSVAKNRGRAGGTGGASAHSPIIGNRVRKRAKDDDEDYSPEADEEWKESSNDDDEEEDDDDKEEDEDGQDEEREDDTEDEVHHRQGRNTRRQSLAAIKPACQYGSKCFRTVTHQQRDMQVPRQYIAMSAECHVNSNVQPDTKCAAAYDWQNVSPRQPSPNRDPRHRESRAPTSPKRPVPPPLPVQQADELLLAFLDRLQKYSETTAAEQRKWEEEEAARQQEIQRQLAEAEAARQQAEADQNQARYQATMDLTRDEATYGRLLRRQHFHETEERQEPTTEEADKEGIAVLMESLLYTCNWQQRELLATRQVLIRHETTLKAVDNRITSLQAENRTLHAANSQQQTLNHQLQADVSNGLAQLSAAASTGSAAVDCSPALTAQAKRLEEPVNHLVASLGHISKFAGASTVSNQLQTLRDRVDQRPVAVAKEWKMPNFKIEKFDDYHKTDLLQWWMAFNAEADVHHTPPLRRLDALYLQLIGRAQAFMTHMAATLECTITTLHTKIMWEEFEKKWKTRFMVNNDKLASSRVEYENYAVELVPPLNQPLHVQDSSVCAAVPPSDNEPVASPAILSEDPSTWARLEYLDPLTVEDFQWLPLPSTGSLPTPHCNALMAHLREYLHAAVPPPSTDGGVAVVDLCNYLAKIDREYATKRYVDINAPLLYIRIQIGKATCSALIDCGATRNYISQDFMARVGLGPRVRRKSQPTHVTLADGHTQKSIDRCVDSVPVYFAPLASEAVSFDILDTKFDMILGISWLQSEDHPVNFHRRTVHVRDRHGELVPCTVPLPHPSIGCHVVSAGSIRQSIRRNDIEEMGICFLHALPPGDQPKTDTSDPRIIELLDSYGDVFQAPAEVIPDWPIRHGITLEDGAVPPRGCIYRMSEEELQVLRAQLDNLLAKGWIRPSCSPYGAPVLFVRKKNKDLRFDSAAPKYFSKLDLKSGYHQIEIQPRDRYKTAFKTRHGHFEWIVMPFGLTNAPATFQAAMTTEFRDLLDHSVLIYLDDILVYSRSLDEHLEHLRAVLERLRIAKYKANRDKCELARQELEYLGHYVTPQGIRLLADKLQAIQDWPDLKCTTDVRSFLGLALYYMRFVKGFQCIAAPLSRLQSPLVPIEFSDEARHAFHTLKTALLQAPVLSIYDPTLPTKVTTDASGYGIGAVLEQHDGTDWHPVEYFSQKVPPINTLDDARKNELLAFVSVLKRWRHFLLGRRRFTWATDNNPLTYYKTQDTVSSTIGRWIHGVPEDIVSDRDTRFMSAFWTALMVESDTNMKPSSARHPQTDGQTERAHRTAQMMLLTLIRPDQKDLVDRLPDIEFAYSTSVHPTIGVTPFELHHGRRKGRIFTDILLPRAADIEAACYPASTRKYRELLAKAHANMQKAQVPVTKIKADHHSPTADGLAMKVEEWEQWKPESLFASEIVEEMGVARRNAAVCGQAQKEMKGERIGQDFETKDVLEHRVHSRLEAGRGITETKRHDGKLVVPKTRTESGLRLVLLGYADLVISATKIDLREKLVAGEAVEQIIRTGHRIIVFDRIFVETAIIEAKAESAILLAIEEDRCTPWGRTRFNEALTKQLVNLAFKFLGFGNREAIWGAMLNTVVRFEPDVVLDIAHRVTDKEIRDVDNVEFGIRLTKDVVELSWCQDGNIDRRGGCRV